MSTVRIGPGVEIDENELNWDFTRGSGPGGQNVNKVETAVQLRFDVANSPSLPDDVRNRLLKLERNRITDDGVLLIESRATRSQLRNRKLAQDQLVETIRNAMTPPKRRRKTKPTRASQERRLARKNRRSQVKSWRKPVRRDDE